MSYLARLAGILALGFAVSAAAHSYDKGDLHIDHPWARATISSAKAGAAYFSVENHGAAADKLIGAETPVADRAEFHEHRHEGGVMKMRPVEGGIEIPASQTVKLAPGGYHLMLMGLKQPLTEGEQFPVTLTFEKAGSVVIDVKVEGAGAPAKATGPSSHAH